MWFDTLQRNQEQDAGAAVLRAELGLAERASSEALRILDQFDTKLARLETEMKPIDDVTQALSRAQDNISATLKAMEDINAHFQVASHVNQRLATEAGQTRPDLRWYLDALPQIARAVAYLNNHREYRSSTPMIGQLTKLEARVAGQCLAEFETLLHSCGPSAAAAAASEDRWAPRDVIGPESARDACGIATCLTRLGDTRPLEFYTRERSSTVLASINKLTRDAVGSAGEGAAAGTGGSSKSSRALSAAKTVRSIAAKAGDIRHATPRAPRLRRKSNALGANSAAPDFGDGLMPTAPYQIGRHPWLKVIRIVQATLEGEIALWAQLLPPEEASEQAFYKVAAPAIQRLCDQGEEAVAQMVQDAHWSSVEGEGVVVSLDLFEELVGRQKGLRLSTMNSRVLHERLRKLKHTLADGVTMGLLKLWTSVHDDSIDAKSLPRSGTVHVLTSNTVRAMRRILAHDVAYASFLRYRLSTDYDEDGRFEGGTRMAELVFSVPRPDQDRIFSVLTLGQFDIDSRNSLTNVSLADVGKSVPAISSFLHTLLESLLTNLEGKRASFVHLDKEGGSSSSRIADVSRDARRHLFIANNFLYLKSFLEEGFASATTEWSDARDSSMASSPWRGREQTPLHRESADGAASTGGERWRSVSFAEEETKASGSSSECGSVRFSADTMSASTTDALTALNEETEVDLDSPTADGAADDRLAVRTTGSASFEDTSLSTTTTAATAASTNDGRRRSVSFADQPQEFGGGGSGGGGGGGGGGDGSGGAVPFESSSLGPGSGSVSFEDGSSPRGGGSSDFDAARARASTFTRLAERINATPMLQSIDTRFQTARKDFLECGWVWIAEHTAPLQDAALVEKKGGRGVLTLESGRILKRRFESFNSEFEELTAAERALAVPDADFRAELRTEVSQALLPRFTTFYEKYSKVQFSKKHMAEYTRITPAIAKQRLDELFSGL